MARRMTRDEAAVLVDELLFKGNVEIDDWSISTDGHTVKVSHGVPAEVLKEISSRGLNMRPAGECIADVANPRELVTMPSWRDYPDRWNDWDNSRYAKRWARGDDPRKVWWVPKDISGSDYSGGWVERSNYQAIVNLMKEIDAPVDEEGEDLVRFISGGHDTFGVAIRGDVQAPELLKVADDLQSYCVLDGDLWSEMEFQAQTEQAQEFIIPEFFDHLSRWAEFELDAGLDPNNADIEDLTETIFWRLEPEFNEEAGGNYYVDVERLLRGMDELLRTEPDLRRRLIAALERDD